MLRLEVCGLTDVGRSRNHNEDYFGIDQEHRMFVVADGMGGHNHGEVASRLAVKAMQDFVAQTADQEATWPHVYDPGLQRHSNRLKSAIRTAHERVLKAIRSDGSLVGMGTTVVGVLLEDDIAAVAHVGDSRAYRYRGGDLELLTEDHTWVNEQVVAGYLSAEQARGHPLKNVVTRALGGDDEIVVDIQELEVSAGDVFVLCSDGLTTMLDDDEIARRLAADDDSVESVCRSFVEDANQRGGLDNITVVVVRVVGDCDGHGPT